MFSPTKKAGATKSIVDSVAHITKSTALSTEEWDKLEESAERIQKTIVGSLKTVLSEVQDALASAPDRVDGGGGGAGGAGSAERARAGVANSGSEAGQLAQEHDVCAEFREVAQQRKAHYEAFISDMRQNAAFEFRAKVQRFCKSLLEGQRFSRQDTVDIVQRGMAEFEDILRQHALWAARSQEAKDQALESLEHYVVTRLHKRIFAPDIEARQHDAALRMRIARLQFIRPEHLDIPAANRHADAWARAVDALQAMSQKLTPLEKLDCVFEAASHIYSAPRLNAVSAAMSADDFLPVLVYVLLRANPPELQSNVDFVSSYRSPERLTGERAYFFTHLAGAVYFIETLDASRLSIEPVVFQRLMEANEDDDNIYSSIVLTPASARTPLMASPAEPSSQCGAGGASGGGGNAGALGPSRGATHLDSQALFAHDTDGRGGGGGGEQRSPVLEAAAVPAVTLSSFQEFRERSGLRDAACRGGDQTCDAAVTVDAKDKPPPPRDRSPPRAAVSANGTMAEIDRIAQTLAAGRGAEEGGGEGGERCADEEWEDSDDQKAASSPPSLPHRAAQASPANAAPALSRVSMTPPEESSTPPPVAAETTATAASAEHSSEAAAVDKTTAPVDWLLAGYQGGGAGGAGQRRIHTLPGPRPGHWSPPVRRVEARR